MVPDLGEESVCLLAGSITTALPHCSYHHFISNRKIGAPMEACGSLRLFLGYSYFSEFLFKSGPSRPTGGSSLFCCSLGACPGFMCAVVAGVLGRGKERESEGGSSRERWRRGIETLPLCHCAPTSARVTHLPANILPPCPDAAGKARSASEWGHRVQREPVGEDS